MRLFLAILFLVSVVTVNAQEDPTDWNGKDFQERYLYVKTLLKAGKYEEAKTSVLPLMSDHEKNPFRQYGYYFYGFASFKLEQYADAKDKLVVLYDGFPKWENRDDALYLLANIELEQGKIKQALKRINDFRDKDLKKQADTMKLYYYEQIGSIDSLEKLLLVVPEDKALAKVLAGRLINQPLYEKERMLLGYLIQEYNLDKKQYNIKVRSIKKDKYRIGVLFPLNTQLLSSQNRRVVYTSQLFQNMYKGIELAVDSLKALGIDVELFLYDTQGDSVKLAELLALPEMKTMDLIIGPVSSSLSNHVALFAYREQIPFVNPLSPNKELVVGNEFAYLVMPSSVNQALACVAHAKDSFSMKSTVIFYGEKESDSIAAVTYRDAITKAGFRVDIFTEINDKTAQNKYALLDTNKIAMDTVSHVFAFVSDDLGASKVLSELVKRTSYAPVFVPADWLKYKTIGIDQIERRNIYLIYPDYINFQNKKVQRFEKQFYEKVKYVPNNPYTYITYDLTLFFSSLLYQHGTYFGDVLAKNGFVQGFTLTGYDYTLGGDNRVVPICKFKNHKLVLVNKHKLTPEEEKEVEDGDIEE